MNSETEIRIDLGRAIKIIRTVRGYKQTTLARKAGLSTSYVSLIERNLRDPTFSTLVKLATALDCPLWELAKLATAPSFGVLLNAPEGQPPIHIPHSGRSRLRP